MKQGNQRPGSLIRFLLPQFFPSFVSCHLNFLLDKGWNRGQPDPARPWLLGGAGGVGGQHPRDGVHLDALPARGHRPLGHLHLEQGDPAEGNSSSLLQQKQPAEQHRAQVNSFSTINKKKSWTILVREQLICICYQNLFTCLPADHSPPCWPSNLESRTVKSRCQSSNLPTTMCQVEMDDDDQARNCLNIIWNAFSAVCHKPRPAPASLGPVKNHLLIKTYPFCQEALKRDPIFSPFTSITKFKHLPSFSLLPCG